MKQTGRPHEAPPDSGGNRRLFKRAIVHELNQESIMKVKTNVRAGKQGRGADNPVGTEDPTIPAPVVPPVTRCVGI